MARSTAARAVRTTRESRQRSTTSETDVRRTTPDDGAGAGTHERIFAIVRRIPRGRVATYGQIASLAGLDRHARLVGYAMSALPRGTRVPWHRVINAKGITSARSGNPAGAFNQRLLLETEGVKFDSRGRVSLERYGWSPRRAR